MVELECSERPLCEHMLRVVIFWWLPHSLGTTPLIGQYHYFPTYRRTRSLLHAWLLSTTYDPCLWTISSWLLMVMFNKSLPSNCCGLSTKNGGYMWAFCGHMHSSCICFVSPMTRRKMHGGEVLVNLHKYRYCLRLVHKYPQAFWEKSRTLFSHPCEVFRHVLKPFPLAKMTCLKTLRIAILLARATLEISIGLELWYVHALETMLQCVCSTNFI